MRKAKLIRKIWKVRPLEKKSVYRRINICEPISGRGFVVEEHYRWGFGYLDIEDNCLPSRKDAETSGSEIDCRNDIGPGTDLDDGVATIFNFDESYSEEEREAIEARWNESSDEYIIESESIVVLGPFAVDLIEEGTGKVIKSNIPLREQEVLKLRIECPTEELYDTVSPWLKEYWSKEVSNTEVSIPENDGDSYFIRIEGDLRDLYDDLLEVFEGQVFAEWEPSV